MLQRFFAHCGLQMATDVGVDRKVELSDLNYPDIKVHIASKSHFHDLRGHCGLQMTSEVKFDLGFEVSDLT